MLKELELRGKMQQVDALVATGYSIEEATALAGASVSAYRVWLADHGNLVPVAIDRLEYLQAENERLRQALAELSDELEQMRNQGKDAGTLAQAA